MTITERRHGIAEVSYRFELSNQKSQHRAAQGSMRRIQANAYVLSSFWPPGLGN